MRELANVLERATILASGRVLGRDVLDLPTSPRAGSEPAEAVQDARRPTAAVADEAPVATLDDVQRAHIQRVLALCGGRLYGRAAPRRDSDSSRRRCRAACRSWA